MTTTDPGYLIALDEARASAAEGGIPVGSAIISDDGRVLGRGRNMRVQNGSHILHGETAAFDSARALDSSAFKDSTIYTTLSPCPMCAGAMIWFGVRRVVVGDNVHMSGREELLRQHGIEVVILDDHEAKGIWARFKKRHPENWPGPSGASDAPKA